MILITELDKAPGFLENAKDIIEEYGHYLFCQLNLKAGTDTFYEELNSFPYPNYVLPHGSFFLAVNENQVIGCAGVKKFDIDSVELKRMYVNQNFRGAGVGSLLCKYVIEWCKKSNYKKILLDTNKEMDEAFSLYKKVGFVEIPAYCKNENPNPIFMAYNL